MAVPARIVQITGDDAIVDAMGNQWQIKTTLCPRAECGRLVLVHAGFAIAEIDEQKARHVWPLIAEIDQFQQEQANKDNSNA